MKILLDECVTKKLKKPLLEAGFESTTVTEAGLSGLKNGKLLAASEKFGFDALLTIDKNMNYQQNISRFAVILIVLDVTQSNIKYLTPLVPKLAEQYLSMEKGQTYLISE
jgi:predicted nuclease of predicted toxin-antitoxin system